MEIFSCGERRLRRSDPSNASIMFISRLVTYLRLVEVSGYSGGSLFCSAILFFLDSRFLPFAYFIMCAFHGVKKGEGNKTLILSFSIFT